MAEASLRPGERRFFTGSSPQQTPQTGRDAGAVLRELAAALRVWDCTELVLRSRVVTSTEALKAL